MTPIRVRSRDGITVSLAGVREPQSVAGLARGSVPSITADDGAAVRAASRGGWIRAGLGFVRNAALGLLLLTIVPIAVVGLRGSFLYQTTDVQLSYQNGGVRERLAEVDRLRSLMIPRDASITPMQAGLAFHALQSRRTTTASNDRGFPMRVVVAHAEPVWRTLQPTPTMFHGLVGNGFRGPNASRIIEMAKERFTTEELAYLRAVAESPVWRDYDRIASASQVDLIGGQFVLPFRDDAFAPAMPLMRFADTKELAYAGVSRAAYYAATRQPERAEAALRSIVSFGFAMIDNGTTALDALIGSVIVGIGRDGLMQWYTLIQDANGMKLAAPLPKMARARQPARTRISVSEVRARLLADASDPRVPRTLRFESLRRLSFGTCSTPRGILFGTPADVNAAFAGANDALARYPSERAFLELLHDVPSRIPGAGVPAGMPSSASDRLIMGTATFAGMVLGNPRVASCTRMVLLSD